MLFSILIPTKNRISNIEKVIKTCLGMAKNPQKIEIIFYTDFDDLESQNFISNYNSKNIFWVTTKNKVTFSDMWNYCYRQSSGKYLMLCGDDVTFETKNWDEKILDIFNAYNDKIVYVVPCDGYQNGKIGVHGFISREWTNCIGRFTAPYFSYWYVDEWIDNVAKKIGRFHYAPEIIMSHNHPSINALYYDALYKENESKLKNPDLHEIWKKTLYEREQEAIILQKYIDGLNKQ